MEQEISILVKLRDEASKQMEQFGDIIEKNRGQISQASNALIGLGGSMAALLGLSVLSSENNPLKQLRVEAQNLQQSIGNALVPAMQSFVNSVTPVIREVTEWIKSHSALVGVLGSVIGSVALLAVGVGTIGKLMLAWQSALKVVTAAQWLWNAAMTANPIGLLIMGITALVGIAALVIANWDKVKSFFVDLWDHLQIGFAETVKFITNTILQPWIKQIEDILAPVVRVIGNLVGIFNKDWGEAITNVGNQMGQLTETINNSMNSIEGTAKAHMDLYDAEQAAATAARDLASANQTISDSFNSEKSSVKSATDAMETYIDILGNVRSKIEQANISGASGYRSYQSVKITPYAKGGIVTKPTLALIGESGPEAVIPLNRSSGNSVSQSTKNEINIGQMTVREEADINKIAQKLWRMQSRKYRSAGALA